MDGARSRARRAARKAIDSGESVKSSPLSERSSYVWYETLAGDAGSVDGTVAPAHAHKCDPTVQNRGKA